MPHKRSTTRPWRNAACSRRSSSRHARLSLPMWRRGWRPQSLKSMPKPPAHPISWPQVGPSSMRSENRPPRSFPRHRLSLIARNPSSMTQRLVWRPGVHNMPPDSKATSRVAPSTKAAWPSSEAGNPSLMGSAPRRSSASPTPSGSWRMRRPRSMPSPIRTPACTCSTVRRT